jgi:DNA-directed RNA polymerase specialized sigma24 family protein
MICLGSLGYEGIGRHQAMDESAGVSLRASDAELLNLIRSGDPGAGDVLRARHAAAARRLAGYLVRDPAAADKTVARAFGQVFDAITRGGGPTDAFRAYLLSAVRRASGDGAGGESIPIPADDQHIPDPGQPLPGPAAGWERSPVVEAFLSLPERWRAVLWHVEIERAAPAEVAPLLGLEAAGLAELAGWARDGLDRGYRQALANRTGGQAGRAGAGLAGFGDGQAGFGDGQAGLGGGQAGLGGGQAGLSGGQAGLGGGQAGRAGGRHAGPGSGGQPGLAAVGSGQAALAGDDVGPALRSEVAPAYLGEAAGYYLADLAGPAGVRGPGDPAPARFPAAVAWLASALRQSSRQQRAIAAGAGALLAVAAVAAYLLTLSPVAAMDSASGHRAVTHLPGTSSPPPTLSPARAAQPSPPGPPGAPPAQLPGVPGGPAGTPLPSAAPSARAAAAPPHSAPSPAAPPRAAPPHTAPSHPAAARAPVRRGLAAGRVTAQVSVFGSRAFGQLAGVAFGVTNSGPAATAELTAVISLPPGTAMVTGWHRSHHRSRREGRPGADGWACRAVAGGAACSHRPIAAAERTGGLLAVWVTGARACGRHVGVTVINGATRSRAWSAETIWCGQAESGVMAAPAPAVRAARSGGRWPGDQWPDGDWPGQWPASRWPGGQWPGHQWPARR